MLATTETRDLDGAAERARLLAVYRGWRRARRGAALPLWLRRSGREVATGLAVFSFVFLVFLDEPLWSIRLFTGPSAPWVHLAPRSGGTVALVFLPVWAVNVWLFHGLLEQVTQEPWRYRRWFLILRSVLAGFPLLGLLVVPAWRSLQKIGPAWALRLRPMVPDLSLARSGRNPVHRPGSVAVFAWLMGSGFLAFALAVLWVMQRAQSDPSRRTETLFVSLPLRLAIFAFLLNYLRSEDVRQSASPRLYRLALAASLSWLIPVPYLCVAGVLIPQAVEPTTARSHTLLWQALVRREGAGRLPLWLALEAALRAPHRIGFREEVQEAQNRVLKLWDLKTFALVFDAAVLGWILPWLGGRHPSWAPGLAPIFRTLWMGALVLGAAGICLGAVHFVLVLFRVRSPLRALDRHPYARYLARAQLALAAGLLFGLSVQQGHAMEAGILMTYLCGSIMMLWGFLMMFRRLLPRTPLMRERFRDMAHEVGLLFALMPIFGLGGPLGLLPGLFIAWVALSPVRAWLIGRTLLPWLLRPFAWRDVFARDLPGRVRWQLGVVLASALLPFGGLAIPLCVWIRHRWWLEAQEFHWRQQAEHGSA